MRSVGVTMGLPYGKGNAMQANVDDPKTIWQPWADWCIENFEKEFGDGGGGGDFDARFLEADTGNDIALIAMTAIKK